tara:strand:+ start:20263 stop:21759 length:1497 start_codon:yes stop_codon:yes gene_type:complete
MKKATLSIFLLGLALSSISAVIAEDLTLMKKRSLIPQNPSDLKITKKIEIKLKDLNELLEEYNLELKNEKLKVEQAKLILKSKISLLYPNLSLISNGLPKYLDGYTYNKPDSSSNTLSRKLTTSISAEIKWDIINPTRRPEINIAKSKFEKAKYSYLMKLRDIRLKVLKNFYRLQQANAEVNVAEKSVEYSKLSLKEANIRLEAGIGTKFELLEAKTQLARDLQLLSNNKGNQRIRERELTEILNLPAKQKAFIESTPEIIGLWETEVEESVIAAFKFRKELDKLLINAFINNNDAKISIASKKPTISLFNTFSTSFSNGQALVSSPNMDSKSSNINNTIGLNATWNLIDGGKAKALYLYNKKKEKEAENKFNLKLAKIRTEVEESFFKLKTSQKNILTSYQEVLSSEESLRLAKLRYKAGITNQREVVNNQRDLTEAKVNHITSITNYNINLSQLSRQTGIDKIQSCIKQKSSSSNLEGSQDLLNIRESKLLPLCKS